MGLHELAVLLDLPDGYQLRYCLSHCGRIVLVRKDPFEVRVMSPGDDSAMHRFVDDDTEVLSVVLDDIDPEELDKYMSRLEALNHNLAQDLFNGAGIEGSMVV